MTLIHVPRPPRAAMNPDRPVSSLLLAQVQHLQRAENSLPVRYCSDSYGNAIRTEGEAAAYIREVTEGIHQAHGDAAAQRAKRARRRGEGLEIAAAAEVPPRKRRSQAKPKKNKRKAGGKKK